MRKSLLACLLSVSAIVLSGCWDEADAPEVEVADTSSQADESSGEDNESGKSLFTTIRCTLTNADESWTTTGTYFTYDDTTVNYPSEIELRHSSHYFQVDFDREHWAKTTGRRRLIDASIEIPAAGPKTAFRPDVKGMYYGRTLEWHFFEPMPDPLMDNQLGNSVIGPGYFFFGNRLGPHEFEGYLEFAGGSGGWMYNGEIGLINSCRQE